MFVAKNKLNLKLVFFDPWREKMTDFYSSVSLVMRYWQKQSNEILVATNGMLSMHTFTPYIFALQTITINLGNGG